MNEQRRYGHHDQRRALLPVEPGERWSRADTLVAIRAGLIAASAAIACLLVVWAVWP